MTPEEPSTFSGGPGVGLTFTYYFSMTTLIAIAALSRGWHLGLGYLPLYGYGVGFGVLAGVLGTYLNRTEILDIPFQNQTAFLKQLRTCLDNLGYIEYEPQDNQEAQDLKVSGIDQIYQRTALAAWFAGKVYVNLSPKSAKIASRAAQIRRIKPLLKP